MFLLGYFFVAVENTYEQFAKNLRQLLMTLEGHYFKQLRWTLYTDKKFNKIFLIYKEIQMERLQSHI
jgi:hypothetical protein